MAISRRLRFEILRRDGHACRYCGSMAPDVKLTVDHVTPVALGGSDEPRNLVTACTDCNSGKTSTQPDSELVEDVAADALRWKRAIEAAVTARLAERELLDDVLGRFEDAWTAHTYSVEVTVEPPPLEPTGDILVDNWSAIASWRIRSHCRPVEFSAGVLRIQVERGYVTDVRRELNRVAEKEQLARVVGQPVESIEVMPGWPGPLPERGRTTRKTERRPMPLPGGWRESVQRFISHGLPEQELHRFIVLAMDKTSIPVGDKFRWFCGCCWRAITDLQEDARRIIETES